MIYKTSLERREERLALLKIKTEEHELKKSKAAAAASQEEEEAKETAATPAQKQAPKDFDNTAHLKQLRHAAFWDIDATLASGLVDEWIVAAKNKAKATGAQVEEYVPPPLGTGLWSKPAPVPGPGVPSTQAAPAGPAPSAVAEPPTASLSGKALSASDAALHLENVKARLNAFLSALAQRAAADPSGITYPTADASSHPSGHPPMAQPPPLPEKLVPIIGSDVVGQLPSTGVFTAAGVSSINNPASKNGGVPQTKPGPTDAGTPPAINSSG
jgi:hypothetical protein